jgi:hypothetical protein
MIYDFRFGAEAAGAAGLFEHDDSQSQIANHKSKMMRGSWL